MHNKVLSKYCLSKILGRLPDAVHTFVNTGWRRITIVEDVSRGNAATPFFGMTCLDWLRCQQQIERVNIGNYRCRHAGSVCLLTVRLTQWVTQWFTERLIEWLTEWLTQSLPEWLTEWLLQWLPEWLTECLTEWLTEWFTQWLTEFDWEVDWVVDSVLDWVVDWVVHCNRGLCELCAGLNERYVRST